MRRINRYDTFGEILTKHAGEIDTARAGDIDMTYRTIGTIV